MDADGIERVDRAVIPLWLKALHVTAVITFVGGLLSQAVFLVVLAPADPLSQEQRASVRVVRRWSRRVTTPAMLLTWAFGLALALRGGWPPFLWLPAKLLFVIALSGLHGTQSGALRRLDGRGGRAPTILRQVASPAIVALTAAIVALAVVKPF